jgi:hypothetical protein
LARVSYDGAQAELNWCCAAACLPLACLHDLRLEVDGLLSLLRIDSKPGGGSDEFRPDHEQQGLFESEPPIALSFAQRGFGCCRWYKQCWRRS